MLFDFTPKVPVSAEARSWIDSSFIRLIDLFGEERFQATRPILPTVEFFPEDFDGELENVHGVFHRVCRYLEVDPERLELHIFEDTAEEAERVLRNSIPGLTSSKKGAAGYYLNHPEQKIRIAVKRSLLTDPTALVATMAHELCHVLLLGDGRISRDEEDMEPLTDLTTVFLGMGIFTANSAVRFVQWQTGYAARRQGYLSQEMYGYALAAWCTLHGETRPAWIKDLTTNVREYCQRSLKAIRHEEARKKK